MAFFSNLGKQCSLQDCQQQDFLPFRCDCCNGIFCLAHRSHTDHHCKKSEDRNCVAVSCPQCAKTLRCLQSQDTNAVLAQHQASACTTRSRDDATSAKKKKPKCCVKGCRAKRVSVNMQRCLTCRQMTCMNHRYKDTHNCGFR
ncbi:unnamed protein product, partial [Heterosigma akashiwo]